jgi:hypothetical protein
MFDSPREEETRGTEDRSEACELWPQLDDANGTLWGAAMSFAGSPPLGLVDRILLIGRIASLAAALACEHHEPCGEEAGGGGFWDDRRIVEEPISQISVTLTREADPS